MSLSPATAFRPSRLVVGLLAAVLLLLVHMLLSLVVGAAAIGPADALGALLAPDGTTEHLTIRELRLPRTLVAAMAGAALGLAGAVMQGLARNRLAEPGILGLNAGAALAVVLGAMVLGTTSAGAAAVLAMLGAGLTALAVYLLGFLGRGGLRSLRLVLAGSAVMALFSALTMAVLLFDQRTLVEIRFWLAGSAAGRDMGVFLGVLPYMLVGLVVALALSRPLTVLSLGDTVARGLGQRPLRVHLAGGVAVTLLAGSSVAVAGPIAFVGLIVPNGVRGLVGPDYRWILPYSALGGAILLLAADMAARLVLRPMEVPVGVMTALLGGPVLIYLARQAPS